MPVPRLSNLLDQNHVHYSLISHRDTYTAAATGAITHIPGKEIAKALMVRVDGHPPWQLCLGPSISI